MGGVSDVSEYMLVQYCGLGFWDACLCGECVGLQLAVGVMFCV
jgi:hypothetical protein